jgi:hypothetical protein
MDLGFAVSPGGLPYLVVSPGGLPYLVIYYDKHGVLGITIKHKYYIISSQIRSTIFGGNERLTNFDYNFWDNPKRN